MLFISRRRTVHLAPMMFPSGCAHMLSLISCLVVVSWLSVPCNASDGTPAPQTSGVEKVPSTSPWNPWPTTWVQNGHKRDISPGAISSTSIPAVPTNTPTTPTGTAATHSSSFIAGIASGSAIVVVVLLCLTCFYVRRLVRRCAPPPRTIIVLDQPLQVQSASSLDTFSDLTDKQSRSTRVLTPFEDDSIEQRFTSLLALFGSDGVPLRELIMLVSLRISTKTSHNHWLVNGERGPLGHAIDAETAYGECSFLEAFTRESSSIESIETFQQRLISSGLINIEYQDTSERFSSEQYWLTDGRIWRINESDPYSSPFRRQLLFEVFLEVFAEIPCKDISPLAERQREIYYYHAHQAMVHLYKNSSLLVEHPQNMKHFLVVILQVLSHRFQKHDEELLRLAQRHLQSSGLHSDWNMILLVAELKATISANGMILSHIRDEVFQAVENLGTRDDSSPRAKGLSGWLLVELLDTAEVQECTEIVDDTVRKGKQWMQRLLSSDLSSLEEIMLCRAFARFGTSDDPEPQARQCDLLFGYHLSRAGCIEKAEKLLSSGLEYYASSPMSRRIWSYRFELVSLMLRAGRWSEAEAWLASARESAVSRNSVIHVPDFWKRSGECPEIFILLGLYQADCDMAMGKLTSAESCLKDTMEITLFVRDYFIRALRLALRTRLLNVQMWQKFWERATVTAQDLVEDIIASGNCLSTIRSSCSIIVTVLTLVNKLLWVGDVLAAARLLESIKRFEDADYRALPLDIKQYLERRRAAVSQLLSLEGSKIYIRPLEKSGADAEDATAFAPVVDQFDREPHANPSRGQAPTSVDFDTQAIETRLYHYKPNPLKQSSAYKWSLELEHARFPAPEAEELDEFEAQSHEAKVLDTKDNGSAQTARHEGYGASIRLRRK